MAGRLQGKFALIVGAGCVGPGWGNGRAACVLFAQEGAKIFAVDRDMAPMEETVARVKEAGGEIVTHLCDVTQQASVAAMVKACKDKYGRIDVLVNNVGGSAPGGPVEMAEEAWDAQIDLNLKSIFLTCKHVHPGDGSAGRRLDHQHGVRLRHPLDRRGAGRLRGVEGRRDPVLARWSRCSTRRSISA